MHCDMISTIKLIFYTSITSLLPFFVCIVRTLKIYSLRKFQVYSTVLLTIISMLLLEPQTLFILQLKVYTLWPASPHFPSIQPMTTIILLSASVSSTFLICVRSHSIYLSCVWLISLSLMSSMFIHVVANGKISFFCMAEYYSIVCIYHIFFNFNFFNFFNFLLICLSMDTKIVSISWLLWIMLQWTWDCRYLLEILI